MSQPTITILPLMDERGLLIERNLLADVLPVHRQLRPRLPTDIEAYTQLMARMATQGARLLAAQMDGRVVGVAVYRIYENTYEGLRLYVDDLITDEATRSQGVGHALLAHCRSLARQADCAYLALDSGTQRAQAHKMYFREGLVVTAFHFTQPL